MHPLRSIKEVEAGRGEGKGRMGEKSERAARRDREGKETKVSTTFCTPKTLWEGIKGSTHRIRL